VAEADRSKAAEEVSAAQRELEKKLERRPTVEEIASKIDLPTIEVERAFVQKDIEELESSGGAAPSQQAERIDHVAPRSVAEGMQTGVCLSGGGIRAAAFAMGSLQALQAPLPGQRGPDTLSDAEFLTAVSGGGYFGGAYEMTRARGIFEFAPAAPSRPFAPGTAEELYVRQRSSFLARTTRERFRLVSHLLIGIGINTLFVLGLLYLAVRPVGWFLGTLLRPAFAAVGTGFDVEGWFGTRFDNLDDLLPLALWISLAVLLAIAAAFGIAALASWIADRTPWWSTSESGQLNSVRLTLQRYADSAVTLALVAFGVVVVVPFSIWLFYDLIASLLDNGPQVASYFSAEGAGGTFLSLFVAGGSLAFVTAAAKNQLGAVKPTWWARIAAFVIVPLILLWVIAVLARGAVINGMTGPVWPFDMPDVARWGMVLLLMCVFWLFADQRSWSMYPVYRERLENAFAVERLWRTPTDPDRMTSTITGELQESLRAAGIGSERAAELIEFVDPRWVAGEVTDLRPDLIPAFLARHLRSVEERGHLVWSEVAPLRQGLYRSLDGKPSETDGGATTVAWRIPGKEKVTDAAAGTEERRYIDFTEAVGASDLAADPKALDAGRQALGPRFVSCAAANIRDAERTAPNLRAASFHFGADKIGSPHNAIRDVDTTSYQRALDGTVRRQDITVPAAIAMSGAAISPAMGKQSKGWLSAFMALANARLGVWLPNPQWIRALEPTMDRATNGDASSGTGQSRLAPFWYEKPRVSYILKEIFGMHAIDDRFLYITDGGHYDNLGLVELLRRGCNRVYVIDASGDEPGVFTTFGQAMALARAELGVHFEVDLHELRGQDDDIADNYEEKKLKLPWRKRTAEARGGVLMHRAHKWGKFHYQAGDGSGGVEGDICYIQTAVTQDTPWQVRAYWEADPRFPNHSTMDQSFTYEEFEAYRSLGYWAAAEARKDAPQVMAAPVAVGR
jgi:hypothetical protein